MSALQIPFRTPLVGPQPASTQQFPPFEQAASGQPALTQDDAQRLIEHCGDGRQAAEAMISSRFAAAYEARIGHFMPRLLSLQTPSGLPVGVCGLREATAQPLFLERYLAQPIEQAIAAAIGQTVERHSIVEVGQLAGRGAGTFRTLILRVTERLHEEGHRWVVFTGTTALRNAFARLGLTPRELAPADPACLSAAEKAAWGSYYQHGPRVMFGDIQEGFAAIAAHQRTGGKA